MGCIIGLSGFNDSSKIMKSGFKIMNHRGCNNLKIIYHKNFFFGYNSHSQSNYVEQLDFVNPPNNLNQPLVSSKSILVFDGVIYNWLTLSKKYLISAKSDFDFLKKLIDKQGVEKIVFIINELDGDFSFAYYLKKEEKLFLARDVSGLKPLVYFFDKKNNQFMFASEKKSLPVDFIHLNPRKILCFNVKKNNISFKNILIKKIDLKKINLINQKILVEKSILKSVVKRVPKNEFALLLSGGIDSALIGKIFQKNNLKFNSYFAGIKDFSKPADLFFAKKVAEHLQSNLKVKLISVNEFEKELPKIIFLIESSDPLKVGIASTIYFAVKNIPEKIVFSGVGADELFAGYNRFKEIKDINNINEECLSSFLKMFENELYFENIITIANKTSLRLPFLDKELVSIALSLNPKLKIVNVPFENKKVLRDFAIELGLPKDLALRPKKAAQYGSNFDKAINFLAKKNNFKSKKDYLNSLNTPNSSNSSNSLNNSNFKAKLPIGVLLSTGKDSLSAMHLMQKKGYEIKCLITIDSKNKDSYMFHTPTIKLARLQSRALNIPLIIVKTNGVKEKELIDLKKAIFKAIKKYDIKGICSGALFSNYQKERIEKICGSLKISSFTPLWHLNQKDYLKFLLKENFSIMITKIACLGLDENWIGKILCEKDLLGLINLEKKFGVNIAGEGGEYETLVLDAPFFKKRILIDFDKKMENEFTGEIILKKAILKEK
ncbi:MAG: diphthine--ammonia ligase [Candidatus ainarchaeum sp.]|nr:diphthine--ammonia ligase [Candidatus ainarchaeum sp.]